MYIIKNFIIFLPFLSFLYFSLVSSFHKNIQSSCSGLFSKKRQSLCFSNVYETESFSDVLLPYLNHEDKILLAAGEIIEKQDRNGSRGLGIVVVDIKSSPDLVFEALTRFGMYQDMIPIVRSSKIISSDHINTVAEFTFSRFLLRVNVKHTIFKQQRLIKFTLDPTRVNLVFKEATGFWHVDIPRDRPEGYCRVY